jgi:hypothetical protein
MGSEADEATSHLCARQASRVEPLFACTKGLRSHIAVMQLALTVTNVLPVAKSLHGIHS